VDHDDDDDDALLPLEVVGDENDFDVQTFILPLFHNTSLRPPSPHICCPFLFVLVFSAWGKLSTAKPRLSTRAELTLLDWGWHKHRDEFIRLYFLSTIN